jgi:hypothetical protein
MLQHLLCSCAGEKYVSDLSTVVDYDVVLGHDLGVTNDVVLVGFREHVSELAFEFIIPCFQNYFGIQVDFMNEFIARWGIHEHKPELQCRLS